MTTVPTDAEVLASIEQFYVPGYLPAPGPPVSGALRRPAVRRGRTVPPDPPAPLGSGDGAQPTTVADAIDVLIEAAVARVQAMDTANRDLRIVLAEELPRIELLHSAGHVGLHRIRRALADAQTAEEKGSNK